MATHTLTTEQLRKLVDAIGDGKNFPKLTDDPKVNYAVDCIVLDDGVEPTYDEQTYAVEAEIFNKN
ncbi:MAG: hypothetical protein Q7K16_04290 [Candidatus Azambacteria bacterium]|nr:hypothetical protein [Candidatus Azambacteria bacterium]